MPIRIRLICAFFCGFGLASCGGAPPPGLDPLAPDPQTARTIAGGDIIGGITPDGADAWLGLGFAAPPVGELRWRAPRPAAAWDGTRSATEYGSACPQYTTGLSSAAGQKPGTLVGAEDCLYLNVFAPRFSPDAVPSGPDALPVMVWIHGGGNTWGSATGYDPSLLATRQNVLVVTVNYRLGPMGWFAHDALRGTAETDADASANFGTLDLIAALDWVQANAAAFGGDTNRVTIFGESAGGHNVASLLISPRAKGLFHRAILQSGSFAITSLDEAETTGAGEFAQMTSGAAIQTWLAKAGSPAPETAADLAAFLRTLPIDEVYAAYHRGAGEIAPPRVIADGVTLPLEGAAVLDDPARYNAVPVISGTNLHENKIFNVFDPALVDRYFGLFFRAKDPDYFDALGEYQALAWRLRAVDEPLRQMQAGGHSAVYAYRFDWDEEGTVFFNDFSRLLGAAHSLEIPFVLGRMTLLGRFESILFNDANAPGRAQVSDAMMAYWGAFARDGAPGTGSDTQPGWTAWDSADGAPKLMVFDTDAGGGVRMIGKDETRDSLFAAVKADPRLADPDKACGVIGRVTAWNPELAEAAAPYLPASCADPSLPSGG